MLTLVIDSIIYKTKGRGGGNQSFNRGPSNYGGGGGDSGGGYQGGGGYGPKKNSMGFHGTFRNLF
jgi:hypothetical protein